MQLRPGLKVVGRHFLNGHVTMRALVAQKHLLDCDNNGAVGRSQDMLCNVKYGFRKIYGSSRAVASMAVD